MAFFPFTMAPMDSMEAMQNCFRQANRGVPPFMAMGMPMMAHSQAQADHCWQRPQYPGQRDEASNGHNNDDIFHVELDVQHFSPEEISVKMVDNHVIIEGKHDEREFRGRSAARHFVHNYTVPNDVKFEDITSTLSSDGILTVSVPKAQSKKETNERVIPITPTGLPTKKPTASEPSSSKSNGESKE